MPHKMSQKVAKHAGRAPALVHQVATQVRDALAIKEL